MLVGFSILPLPLQLYLRSVPRVESPYKIEALAPLFHGGDAHQVVPIERHPGAESRSPGRLLAIPVTFVASVALRLETVNQLTMKAQGYFLPMYVRKFAHSLDFGRGIVLIVHGGLPGSPGKIWD